MARQLLPIPAPTPAAVDRFWSKVDKGEACWTWTGGLNPKGYGEFYIGSHRHYLAHRVSCAWFGGGLPDGLFVDHLCHNTRCVRPDHLRASDAVTNGQNRKGPSPRSTTGIRGVHWAAHAKAYSASYGLRGRTIHVGYFKDIEEAGRAAEEARAAAFEVPGGSRFESCIFPGCTKTATGKNWGDQVTCTGHKSVVVSGSYVNDRHHEPEGDQQ